MSLPEHHDDDAEDTVIYLAPFDQSVVLGAAHQAVLQRVAHLYDALAWQDAPEMMLAALANCYAGVHPTWVQANHKGHQQVTQFLIDYCHSVSVQIPPLLQPPETKRSLLDAQHATRNFQTMRLAQLFIQQLSDTLNRIIMLLDAQEVSDEQLTILRSRQQLDATINHVFGLVRRQHAFFLPPAAKLRNNTRETSSMQLALRDFASRLERIIRDIQHSPSQRILFYQTLNGDAILSSFLGDCILTLQAFS